MSETKVAQVMKALAHPHRIRIIQALAEQERCVHELEERLGVKQSNLSQHLRILRNQGILECQRRGMVVCYRIRNEQVFGVLASSEKCLREDGNHR